MSNSALRVASETRKMWFIDLPLFLGALAAALSGMYFLFLPVGGFQGGRNPWYGVTVLFSRGTWDDIHTWTGALMIAAAVVHVVVHRAWISRMAGRLLSEVRGGCGCLNRCGRFNLATNAALGLAFLLTAVSGVVLMFMPVGRQVAAPVFVWDRATWDILHTWSGTLLIAAAVVHFAIHWRWAVKVTGNLLRVWRAGLVTGEDAGRESAVA
jgi:hypothetical protein